ncbi:MAG TPA: NAD(P)/FAD-dependent oxidoreductase [Polyangiaceae bacterium]|jgi:cation diffusion facilitator CzcD-associated flavoprotein CzcO
MSVETKSVLIIGTGFAGLGMGIRLKKAGIHDFLILEAADEVGGTWRDNHYPGAACDVPSHLYSFSFEPNPKWTRSFGEQEEILTYLKHCADKYGLRPHLRFHSEVKRAAFDERSGTWEVEAQDGRKWRAPALVSGCGGLSRPSYPDIKGLERYEGKKFHTARWDKSFAPEGKTIGVIGTGASAIQIVPAIAPKVERLHVFQRTPPWIMPKDDRDIGPRQRARFAKAPALQQLARTAIYWSLEWRALAFTREPWILEKAQPLALRYLKRKVPDAELRAKLTPHYTLGCKRVLLSNDYFQALQRPHVELVTDGIAEVTARGVKTKDGVERPLDALVLATGFQAAELLAPFETRGRGGRDLNEEWKNGAEAYLGTTVSGFPNFFMIVGPNTGLGHNSMVFIIESQIQYVMDCLRTMREKKLKFVDVRADAQARYNERIQQRMARTVWNTGGCSSWYRTKDGKNTTLWPGFTAEFRMRTRRFDPAPYELVAHEERRPSHGTNSQARADVAAAE